MSRLTVVLDACVLFPAPLRSFLMYVAVTDLVHARWSNHIHAEWMRNVGAAYTDVTQSQVERIRELMDSHVRNGLVKDYERLITSLALPDPDDRHVLAAAIQCQAGAIVTFNLADFPDAALLPHGIRAIHPDDFACALIDVDADGMCTAANSHRASLKNPPMDVPQFLATLERLGLIRTVARLATFAENL